MNDQGDMFVRESSGIIKRKDAAIKARDRALKSVADNSEDWMEKALEALKYLSTRREWTGEDIRLLISKPGIVGAPHHHNAWGALINTAVRRKLIVATGRYESMKTTKSHARKTPVYRVGAARFISKNELESTD